MTAPTRRKANPHAVPVESGKAYLWCACGESQRFPYCDGSHVGTGLTPHRYFADKARTILVCGCGRSARMPLCDGTHARPPQGRRRTG
ncbi:CDGSH iron-sulfur domain-containing protein [Rhodospirillaceae bacterium KN72]|uniref:CDGSH iron-sulfur domain-containing protein n=1 Tax=Pacificispira spongiicola TaxID=2729598 RepID=A0A7Y0HEE6_9PROT|nr:CDGSH iron-sulfur domain-containing protein [Pacificispira spongiicola]NMM44600.1 CDGSH iron-sulfur domain-containing protein [Pacificispira spongiicola]